MRHRSRVIRFSVGLATLGTLGSASPVLGQARSPEAATQLLEEGRHAEARSMLDSLARERPNDPHVAALMGVARTRLNEADEAVRDLERAVRLAPDSARYHFWLAQAYQAQVGSAGRLRQRGIALRIRGSLERVIELDPEAHGAYMQLVHFHLRAPGIAGGDRDRALEYANALHRRNSYLGAFMQVDVHLAAADTAAADRTLARLVSSFPDSVPPRVRRSVLNQARGLWDASWEAVRPLVERDPPHGPALFFVGRISALSGGDLDRGERALRDYLEHAPGPGEPPHAAAHHLLGEVMRHRGDMAGARAQYETALRLNPDLQPAIDALRALR